MAPQWDVPVSTIHASARAHHYPPGPVARLALAPTTSVLSAAHSARSAPDLAIVLSEVSARVDLASEGAASDTDAGAAVGAGGWDSAGALDGRIGVLRGAGTLIGTIRFGIRMTRATATHLPAAITTAASAIQLTPTRLTQRRVPPTVFLLRRSTRHPLRKAQPTESERCIRIADS